jgi:type II secretory pathway component PulK
MTVRNERGIALVVVLLIVALLSITTLEFAFSAQIYTHMARNALSGLQANLLARSGVNLGEAILGFDDDPQVDAFSEEWCPEPAEASCVIDGAQFGLPDNMLLRIEIFDESGKLNINLTKPRNQNEYTSKVEDPTRFLLFDMWRIAFERLLESEGIDPEAAQRLYEYWDLRIEEALNAGADAEGMDEGDTGEDEQGETDGETDTGADGAADRQVNSIFATINFTTIEDANAVLQLPADQMRRLRRFLTAAAGVTRVNANTAPAEVLLSIIDDEGLVQDILTRRLDMPMASGEITALVPPVSVGEAIPDGRRMLFGSSDIFRIVASGIVNPNPLTGRGGIGRSASLLVRRRQSRSANAGQDAPVAWTFTRLDWQKEGGALLFEEPVDPESQPNSIERDSRFF